MRIVFIIFSILLINTSCIFKKDNTQKKIVAETNNRYLYLEDIEDIIPNNVSKEDSTSLAKGYIQDWIKNSLLLEKAELNLTEEEKDINKLVDDYRASLIIHKYQQKLLKQKLDTLITPEILKKYYQENLNQFELEESIVKARVLKVLRPVPEIKKLRKLLKFKNQEDSIKLFDYCSKNSKKILSFNDKWISFSNLTADIYNVKISNIKNSLKRKKIIEREDINYKYFIFVTDLAEKNTTAPITYIKKNIINLILLKRKINFIKKIETEIYREAQQNNKFKIH